MNGFEALIELYKSGVFNKIAWCDVRSSFEEQWSFIPHKTESASRIAFGSLNKPSTLTQAEWEEINPKVVLKISQPLWEIDGLKEEAEIYQAISKFILSNYYSPNIVLCLAVSECDFDFSKFWFNEQNKAIMTEWFRDTDPPWMILAERKMTMLKRAKKTEQVAAELAKFQPEYERLFEKYTQLRELPDDKQKIRMVVTERIFGESLASYVDRNLISDEDLVLIVYQVLFTLSIFNHFGIRHGDFHPNNLLVQRLEVPSLLAYVTDTQPVAGSRYTMFETKWVAKIFDWDFGGIYETLAPLKDVINNQAIIEGFCSEQAACGRNDKADMTRLLLSVYDAMSPRQDIDYAGKLDKYPKFARLIETIYDRRIIANFHKGLLGMNKPADVAPGECPADVKSENLYIALPHQPWTDAPDCWIKPIKEILTLPVFQPYQYKFDPSKSNIGTRFIYGLWPDQSTREKWIGDAVAQSDSFSTVKAEERNVDEVGITMTIVDNLTAWPQNMPLIFRPNLHSVLFSMLAALSQAADSELRDLLDSKFLFEVRLLPLQNALEAGLEYGRKTLELGDPELFIWLSFIAALPQFSGTQPSFLYTKTTGLSIYSANGEPIKASTPVVSLGVSSVKQLTEASDDVPLFSISFEDDALVLASIVTILRTNYNISSANMVKLIRILTNLPDNIWSSEPILAKLISLNGTSHVDYLITQKSKLPVNAFLVWLYFKFADILDSTAL